jgi:hypothetical protein
MASEVEERQEVQQKFKENAERDGLCTAFNVFVLGGNGTVYAGCGKQWDHASISIEDDPQSQFHQTQQGEPEGALVIFRWPV